MSKDLQGGVLGKAVALIARPSVTPGDGGCLNLIASWLKPLGFTLERIDRNGVSNLWARKGSKAPLLCFAGHVDVVPPGPLERWQSSPFLPTLRDGMLYGRGANDMKSSVAAFVVAVEWFLERQPQHAGSIALLITSDEEGDAIDGTVCVVETLKQRAEAIDYCIVGEPTSGKRLGDMIKNGRRGSLGGHLIVKGVQGHVAYPQLTKNPVHLAAPALAELAVEKWDDGNEHFPPTTFQISNAHAGTGAMNVVPGVFEIDFNFRFATASTPQSLQDRVHAILDRHGLEYDLHWDCSAQPFLTPNGRLVELMVESIRKHTGLTPEVSTSGGTSDGRFIATLCPETVEFGPINATIHQIDECVAVADLEPLARIYEDVMQRLLQK